MVAIIVDTKKAQSKHKSKILCPFEKINTAHMFTSTYEWILSILFEKNKIKWIQTSLAFSRYKHCFSLRVRFDVISVVRIETFFVAVTLSKWEKSPILIARKFRKMNFWSDKIYYKCYHKNKNITNMQNAQGH